VEWRTKEKAKGVVTVVQLRSALGVDGGGGVFVSLALFFLSPPFHFTFRN